jgi:hypothetical protein
MRKFTLTSATALLFTGSMALTAGAQSARDGRVMWSAFQCATFAELSGNTKEQERLFTIGVKAGRQFVEALQNGQISREALSSEVPIGVSMLLAGPSVDFIIGRIFENAMRDAYDNAVKDGTSRRDGELRKLEAEQKYLRGNCALIR